jgi:hypothetical protein
MKRRCVCGRMVSVQRGRGGVKVFVKHRTRKGRCNRNPETRAPYCSNAGSTPGWPEDPMEVLSS